MEDLETADPEAAEVSTQTDEDPIAKDLAIAVLQKQLVSNNPVAACHLCVDMVNKLLVEAYGKNEMKAEFSSLIEKYKAEFSSLTACDDDGTPRWELMGFAKKC